MFIGNFQGDFDIYTIARLPICILGIIKGIQKLIEISKSLFFIFFFFPLLLCQSIIAYYISSILDLIPFILPYYSYITFISFIIIISIIIYIIAFLEILKYINCQLAHNNSLQQMLKILVALNKAANIIMKIFYYAVFYANNAFCATDFD